MANPYTSQSISGYNSSPPPDDGSNTAANEITWAKHKTKLADPIKILSEGIDSAAAAAFAKIFGAGTTSTGIAYTVLASDQGKLVIVTAGVTITTPAAAVEGTPFVFGIKNNHSAAITVDGNGSETIDGAANISLPAGSTMIITTDGTNWFTVANYGSAGTVNTGVSSGQVPLMDATGYPAADGSQITGLSVGRGYIDGLILSNDATDPAKDIGIATGVARDDSDSANLSLASALVKQLDASWAVGTNAGALDGTETVPGTPDASTWYHIWIIRRSDTGVVDILASESATAPTMPTNYDQKRRIGAVLFDATPDIITFTQFDDEFIWDVPVLDYNTPNPGTSATTRTLTVPTGLVLRAVHFVTLYEISINIRYGLVTSLDQTDSIPSVSRFNIGDHNGSNATPVSFRIKTNTSGQIRTRVDGSDANLTLKGLTAGWIDPRGRDA